MTTKVRSFLRTSEPDKARALRGKAVHLRDEKGGYLGTGTPARKTLLGAARGKITIRGDLTQPTLTARDWASL